MPVRLIQRNGTATQWTTANPTLAEGEMGVETDTGKFKIGNGTQNWNALAYGGLVGPQGPVGPQGIQGIQGPVGQANFSGDIDGGHSGSIYGGNTPIDGGNS